jgi:peroxiredoxin
LPRYAGAVAKEHWHPKATAAVAVAERQWADVTDLVRRVRKAGFAVSAVHLTRFGTVRVRTQFGLDKPSKEAQESIEAVHRKAPWLADAKFTAAGTRPDFNLAKSKEVRAGFVLGDSQVIELGALLDGLSGAGFPPKAMCVARMFAGVPFGFPIPGDVELADAAGTKLRSGKLHKAGRPPVLIFFPLTGKYKQGKDGKAYRAEPAHFARLKEVAGRYADRVDFVAVSSPKEDSPADVAALWRKAALPFPVYRDPEQKLATALSAGLAHPPPHIFILDAAGKLRYAGEFADGWVEPEQIKHVHLVEALERVLAKKYADNGAVFNNSPPCACSDPACKCPKCGCGGPCRCGCSTGAG